MILSRFIALASKCDWMSVTGTLISLLAILVTSDNLGKSCSIMLTKKQRLLKVTVDSTVAWQKSFNHFVQMLNDFSFFMKSLIPFLEHRLFNKWFWVQLQHISSQHAKVDVTALIVTRRVVSVLMTRSVTRPLAIAQPANPAGRCLVVKNVSLRRFVSWNSWVLSI